MTCSAAIRSGAIEMDPSEMKIFKGVGRDRHFTWTRVTVSNNLIYIIMHNKIT